MASYEKRGNSYRIKASCGYNAQGKQVFQRMTWTPPEGMTEKQIEKELNRQYVLFDEECKKGFVVSPIKFEAFAEQWFEEYANLNLRSTTLTRSRQLTKRTYEAIGHIRLDKLNARVIQRFINSLTAEGTNQNTGKGLAKKDDNSLSIIYLNRAGLCNQNGYAQYKSLPQGYDTQSRCKGTQGLHH